MRQEYTNTGCQVALGRINFVVLLQYFASSVQNLRLLSQVWLLDFCRNCTRGVGACGGWDSLTLAGSPVADCCDHGNELSVSFKDRDFL